MAAPGRITGSMLGLGTLSNSSQQATRRIFTISNVTIAAGTRIRQFTQEETSLATIEAMQINIIPSFVVAKASASLAWVASATGGFPHQSGTITIREQTKTLNRIVHANVVFWGRPDPARVSI